MPPEGYVKIRDKLKKEGKSDEEAKETAAKIWNKKHPENPVGRGKHHEEPQEKILIDE